MQGAIAAGMPSTFAAGDALAPRPPATRALDLQLAASGGDPVVLDLDCGKAYRLVVSPRLREDVLARLMASGPAGLVPSDGGLVGNLKIWENLALPAAWRGETEYGELEQRARGLFSALGFPAEDFPSLCRSMPEDLSRLEARIVAFVRAVLGEPDLLVYDGLFDGLTRAETDRALGVDRLFHLQFPFRTSVYVDSELASLADAPVYRVYDLR
jgi:predicted ABC-type transport system involved in lysophospholipase L1 biosynthesis ATPase subunit